MTERGLYLGLTKRRRRQLAKSEVLIHLSMTADRWGSEVAGTEPGTLPFAEWSADDPLRVLCRTYRLDPADLAQVCKQVSEELEARAERAGYDCHLDEDGWPLTAGDIVAGWYHSGRMEP